MTVPRPLADPAPGTVRVLVVDPSPASRRALRDLIDADPGFRVVGEASAGREVMALVGLVQPTVILLSLDLPVDSGSAVETVEEVMAHVPTPILVCAARPGALEQSADRAAALAAGALDVVIDPVRNPPYGGSAGEWRRQLRVASRVRVITHPRARLRQERAGSVPESPVLPAPAAEPLRPSRVPLALVVIGVSTGGPPALATVLSDLPARFEPAVLVVQHMAESFLPGLAAWLDERCELPVSLGRDGGRLVPGTVTLAPGGSNLLVAGDLSLRTEPVAPTQFHVPSIDATFQSVATSVGAAAAGVLLTGMGRDGAAGLLAMRSAGAQTIAQDEASSAVFGMPAAAIAIDAAGSVRPLDEIASSLTELAGVLPTAARGEANR